MGSRVLGFQLNSCGSRALERGLSSFSSALESTGSVVVVHRLNCGMWDLTVPGVEPVSLAL